MYSVKEFYEKQRTVLGLKLIAGRAGLRRAIKIPEAHMPGLSLSGYLKGYEGERFLIFGNVEMHYLRDLDQEMRLQRLSAVLGSQVPAAIIGGSFLPVEELLDFCDKESLPLFHPVIGRDELERRYHPLKIVRLRLLLL